MISDSGVSTAGDSIANKRSSDITGNLLHHRMIRFAWCCFPFFISYYHTLIFMVRTAHQSPFKAIAGPSVPKRKRDLEDDTDESVHSKKTRTRVRYEIIFICRVAAL